MNVIDATLFGTPLLVSKFAKHKEYCERIELFEKSSKKPNVWLCDLYTTFPNTSEDDEHIGGQLLDDLKQDILEHVKNVMREFDLPDQILFQNFWYNAYYTGQGQEIHNHLCRKNYYNPFWSGIYFHRNCFPESLIFTRTDTLLRSQQTCDWENTKLASFYNDLQAPPISDGEILLFPPHLLHSVIVDERNATDMRLTFSFNVMIGQVIDQGT